MAMKRQLSTPGDDTGPEMSAAMRAVGGPPPPLELAHAGSSLMYGALSEDDEERVAALTAAIEMSKTPSNLSIESAGSHKSATSDAAAASAARRRRGSDGHVRAPAPDDAAAGGGYVPAAPPAVKMMRQGSITGRPEEPTLGEFVAPTEPRRVAVGPAWSFGAAAAGAFDVGIAHTRAPRAATRHSGEARAGTTQPTSAPAPAAASAAAAGALHDDDEAGSASEAAGAAAGGAGAGSSDDGSAERLEGASQERRRVRFAPEVDAAEKAAARRRRRARRGGPLPPPPPRPRAQPRSLKPRGRQSASGAGSKAAPPSPSLSATSASSLGSRRAASGSVYFYRGRTVEAGASRGAGDDDDAELVFDAAAVAAHVDALEASMAQARAAAAADEEQQRRVALEEWTADAKRRARERGLDRVAIDRTLSPPAPPGMDKDLSGIDESVTLPMSQLVLDAQRGRSLPPPTPGVVPTTPRTVTLRVRRGNFAETEQPVEVRLPSVFVPGAPPSQVESTSKWRDMHAAVAHAFGLLLRRFDLYARGSSWSEYPYELSDWSQVFQGACIEIRNVE